jgi:hypothetical protein
MLTSCGARTVSGSAALDLIVLADNAVDDFGIVQRQIVEPLAICSLWFGLQRNRYHMPTSQYDSL